MRNMESAPRAGKLEPGRQKRGKFAGGAKKKTWGTCNLCQGRGKLQAVPYAGKIAKGSKCKQSRTQSPQALWTAVGRREKFQPSLPSVIDTFFVDVTGASSRSSEDCDGI